MSDNDFDINDLNRQIHRQMVLNGRNIQSTTSIIGKLVQVLVDEHSESQYCTYYQTLLGFVLLTHNYFKSIWILIKAITCY